jgi:hypothetical protein
LGIIRIVAETDDGRRAAFLPLSGAIGIGPALTLPWPAISPIRGLAPNYRHDRDYDRPYHRDYDRPRGGVHLGVGPGIHLHLGGDH